MTERTNHIVSTQLPAGIAIMQALGITEEAGACEYIRIECDAEKTTVQVSYLVRDGGPLARVLQNYRLIPREGYRL